MSGYIGRDISYGNAVVDHFTGNGGATYTLTYDTNTNGVVVSLDGVVQKNGTDFNVTGTSLVFTSTVASPIAIQVIYTGLTLTFPTPADNTVSTTKIVNNAVDETKLADGTVSTAKIVNNAVDETKLKDALIGDFTDATVTASDTFLHGDATDSGNTKRDTIQGILDLASPSVNVDTFTIDQSTTGSQSVTGVGFQPVGVFFNCVQSSSDEASFGFSDGTTEKAIRDENGQTSDTWSWSNSSIHLIQDGSNNSSAVVASFDADGFTLTKSKSGSPTGTNQVTFLAIG